jgi:hypothetical protein
MKSASRYSSNLPISPVIPLFRISKNMFLHCPRDVYSHHDAYIPVNSSDPLDRWPDVSIRTAKKFGMPKWGLFKLKPVDGDYDVQTPQSAF